MNLLLLRAAAALAVAATLVGLARHRAPAGATWVATMPALRQELPYSCGAAALRMVLARFRIFLPEAALRDALGTGPGHGTAHGALVAEARRHGLRAEARRNTSPEALRRAVRRKEPTIVALQAWGDEGAYRAAESGHYVVVAGYLADRFFFWDPWDGAVHELTEAELLRRWHDVDSEGRPVTALAVFFASQRETPQRSFAPMP